MTVDVSGKLIEDSEAELRMHMAPPVSRPANAVATRNACRWPVQMVRTLSSTEDECALMARSGLEPA